MSDNVAQLSEAMAIMRKKDVQHLVNRIKELEAKLALAVKAVKEEQQEFNHRALEVILYGATIDRLKNLELAWEKLRETASLKGDKT